LRLKNIYPMLAQSLHRFFKPFMGLPRAVWLLSVVNLINRSGAMVICFLTLYLTESLHFTIKDAGYIMSAFGLGSIGGAYLGGYLTDKLGYYKVQLLMLIANGIILFIALFITNFYSLCVIMSLVGLSAEAFRPANSVAMRHHSDPTIRTRSLSLLRVAVNLAVAFALFIGGLLATLGWHWLFIADGLSCFGAAMMLYFYLNDKSNIPVETPQYEVEKILEKPISPQKTLSAYKDKDYLIFIFSTFMGATVFMQILWTIPAFFKNIYQWNETTIGFVSAINGLCVMIIELPLIFRIEHKRRPLWFVRLGIVLYAISYISLVLPPQFAWFIAVFYMVLISFGEIFVMPFSTNWAMGKAGEARQGQYMALYTMAYSISNVIAPMIGTQVIAAYGFTTLWWVLSGMSILAFLGFLYLEKK
jgi:predicted MFS family arabinose efflux permease